jgi:type II secretory pathway pseudopilin PulG
MPFLRRPANHAPAAAPRRRRGFTLIQLLVVLGIAALLMSLALPAIMRARKSAKRTAMFFQLQMISSALDAYKADFNVYPPVDTNPLHPVGDNGAFALCRALIAPAPAGGTTPNLYDHRDGPGFKMAATGGKVYGPYLQPDNFRIGYAVNNAGAFELTAPGTSFTNADYARLVIADQTGAPILYCPALPAKPRFGMPTVYLVERQTSVGPTATVYYDLDKMLGLAALTTPQMTDFRGLVRQPGETDDTKLTTDLKTQLGADANGQVATLQQASVSTPYLLWSAGADARFGKVGGAANTDDVLLTDLGQ